MNLFIPATLFTAAVVAAPVFVQAFDAPATAILIMPPAAFAIAGTSAATAAATKLPQSQPMLQSVSTPVPGPQASLAPTPGLKSAATPTVDPAQPSKAAIEPVTVQPALAPVTPPKPVVTLTARVNLSTQRMHVSANGKALHTFAISTGREGFLTPRGTFTPKWHAQMWYSKQYDDAPMPHAVFFNGGIATHATTATGMLGNPASHGCVRLSPANARLFYKLVTRHGMQSTRITVEGSTPLNLARRKPQANDGVFAQAPGGARAVAYYPGLSAQPGYTPGSGWGWGAQQPVVYMQPLQRRTTPIAKPQRTARLDRTR